ncbi:MAG: hypothetical protein J0L69_06610 [Bacteroidetes bacterium]|nr:hypothetical protein [Bacteroidota bacterium]
MKTLLLLLCTYFVSIPNTFFSQSLTESYVKNYFDSIIKNDFPKKSDVVKTEYDIVKLINITPKKAILIEIQKYQNKISQLESNDFTNREKTPLGQEQIKKLRSQSKEVLRTTLISLKEDKSYYTNPEINYKMDLIQKVLYEKSIDSTKIELYKSEDDNTTIYYIAQIKVKNYYLNGKIIEKKLSIIFDLHKQFRKELTFEGFVF